MPTTRSATRAAAVITVSALALAACGAVEDDAEGPAAGDGGVTTISVGA
ncbi:MAG TPA: ABC transporter, partial [Janibacter terrae]|nr:ABC transporter [Janibacter terrae]